MSKMSVFGWLAALLFIGYVLDFSSAAAHSHVLDNQERESDGSYRPRDADHYGEDGHNVEFDHEAIIGSVKEAEEFDKLSPEEAKRRLGELLVKNDFNKDKFIDRDELKKWILKSFVNLAKEEAEERFQDVDEDKDGILTWSEYLQDTFGVDTEEEIVGDADDSRVLALEDRAMWKAADSNGDGNLNFQEFEVFFNPEEHEIMHPFLRNQTLREKDSNKDGRIDFQEYIGDRASQHDREWLISEQEKFTHELDTDQNGYLDQKEIHTWVIPNNEELAEEEVDHLFASADDDHDDRLSFDEVLEHHDVFVGSEATDFGQFGNSVMGEHFDDEL